MTLPKVKTPSKPKCSVIVDIVDGLPRSVWFGRRRLAKRRGMKSRGGEALPILPGASVLAGVFVLHLDE